MNIKLLQWNILYKEKVENSVALIKELNPDIVCLQELASDSIYNPGIPDVSSYIGAKLKYNYYDHHAQDNTKRETSAIGNGIFTRFPIVRREYKFVQESRNGARVFWDEGRVYVEIEVQIEGKTLTVGTVHLSYSPHFEITEQKKVEADKLVAIVREKKSSYLLTGDFNALPDSYTIAEVSMYLKDCGPDHSQNTWTTKPFHYKDHHETELTTRLDYIFATPDVNIISSEVVKTEFSDHLPIMTTFEVQ